MPKSTPTDWKPPGRTRKGSWFAALPANIICNTDLKDSDIRVLLILVLHGHSTGECFPGLQTIAKLSGKDRLTVRRSLDRLQSEGIIEIVKDPTKGTGRRFILPWIKNQALGVNSEPVSGGVNSEPVSGGVNPEPSLRGESRTTALGVNPESITLGVNCEPRKSLSLKRIDEKESEKKAGSGFAIVIDNDKSDESPGIALATGGDDSGLLSEEALTSPISQDADEPIPYELIPFLDDEQLARLKKKKPKRRREIIETALRAINASTPDGSPNPGLWKDVIETLAPPAEAPYEPPREADVFELIQARSRRDSSIGLPPRVADAIKQTIGDGNRSYRYYLKLCEEVRAGTRSPESISQPLRRMLELVQSGTRIKNLGAYFVRAVSTYDHEHGDGSAIADHSPREPLAESPERAVG